jgi:imidazolonepropionase-like amidohydrolase
MSGKFSIPEMLLQTVNSGIRLQGRTNSIVLKYFSLQLYKIMLLKRLKIVLVLSAAIWMIPEGLRAQITAKPEFGKFALVNGTVHTITNGSYENGLVLIRGNLIEYAGENRNIDADFTVIDVSGKHIYPGFIDAGTRLGLVEISAIPVTVDAAEVGNFNPHMTTFTAINPSAVAIPVTRVSGVTTVLSYPTSGIIPGKSTLIDLYGYTPDSMAVLQEAALHINWPGESRRGFSDSRSEKEIRRDYELSLKQLTDFLDDASSYHSMMTQFESEPTGKTKPAKNSDMEAMRDVFRGTLPVIISADREKDILNALDWIGQNPGIKAILSSVAEGWRVADQIAGAGVPVIVGPMLRTPSRSYDNYQRPYQNAGLMSEAGVEVAIQTAGTENVRNLPYNAGYAAAYGLGREAAIRAITINPARLLGVSDRLGSLEAGKTANLFVADGDPLETITRIEHVFIRGFRIPLESRHTQLFEEYIERDVK